MTLEGAQAHPECAPEILVSFKIIWCCEYSRESLLGNEFGERLLSDTFRRRGTWAPKIQTPEVQALAHILKEAAQYHHALCVVIEMFIWGIELGNTNLVESASTACRSQEFGSLDLDHHLQ